MLQFAKQSKQKMNLSDYPLVRNVVIVLMEGAAEILDYLEAVHVFVRRPHSSS